MTKVEEETVTFNDLVWYFSKYLPRFFNNTIITGDSKETLVIAIREEDDIEYKTLASVYINEDNKFVFKEERYEIVGNENHFVDSLKVELRLKSKGKKNFDKFWFPFVKRGYYYA
jgi:hypothetical protein